MDVLSELSQAKWALSEVSGIGQDALHVLVGLIIFVAFLIVCRRYRFALPLALTALAVVQIVNEVLDAARVWALSGLILWREAVKDTALTLAVPMVLCGVCALYARRTQLNNGSAE